MPEEYDATRAEDCRYAVLAALAARSHGAHPAESVRIFLRNYDFSVVEIKAALTVMATAGLVQRIENPPPSTGHSWQITLSGLKAHETR